MSVIWKTWKMHINFAQISLHVCTFETPYDFRKTYSLDNREYFIIIVTASDTFAKNTLSMRQKIQTENDYRNRLSIEKMSFKCDDVSQHNNYFSIIFTKFTFQIRFFYFHCLFVFQFVHKRNVCCPIILSSWIIPFFVKRGRSFNTLNFNYYVCFSGFLSCTFERISSSLFVYYYH